MKVVLGGILSLVLFVATVTASYAGGCCFQKFEVSQGVAGYTSARIFTGFVDPNFFEALSNTPIEIHIVNPEVDQSCQMDVETTDGQGLVSAACRSSQAGDVTAFFSSPEF